MYYTREGNGTPLQDSCLENPMDGGAWWAAVHGVAKSRTRLSDFTFTFHFHALEKEMATHSSVLAWRIPETGEPGGLPSMGSHRVGHDWSDLAAAAALYSPWSSPDLNTGVGSLSLLQRIFPTQGSNPGLLHCGWILYQLSHKSSLRILEWVAYPFSSGSSEPRNWTGSPALQVDSLPTELSGKPW